MRYAPPPAAQGLVRVVPIEEIEFDDIPPIEAIPESADGLPDQAPAAVGPLSLICPSAWRGVPLEPMRWLVTNRLPADDAAILSGDGSAGKTTVALQLAVAVAGGLGDWLGATIEAGPVIFFSGEEPEPEMRRRLDRVTRKRGLDPADLDRLHFHFPDPETCHLATCKGNGPMQPTPLLNSLAAAALDLRPALIVVDSIAGTFGGNQNDRVHARTFVSMFRSIAREANSAVLLLDHPSMAGINSGSGRAGSVDWQNATRARLHLEATTDEEGSTGRTLEVKKLNYGPAGEKVKLRWEDGCYVLEGSASAPAKAAASNSADNAYLACLDRLTSQGREVREHKGRNYAPATFADMPEASGVTAKGFRAAQERLFAAGLIHIITDGPPSKLTRRIARKGTE